MRYKILLILVGNKRITMNYSQSAGLITKSSARLARSGEYQIDNSKVA